MTIEYKDSKRIVQLSTDGSTEDVTWNDSTDVGCSISGNTVTKTSGDSWTSGIAKTDEVISASDGGTLTMTTNVTGNFVGLSNVATLNQQAKTWFDVKFGFRYDSIVENGASVTPDVAFTRATSDTMKITVSSAGLVKYYVNDVLKHTSTITASGDYFCIFAAYYQNANLTATILVPSKPTDVQDNSILVEKDTAKIYWRTPELAPTFEDDFDYASQSLANTAWVPNNDEAGNRVNISTDKLDFNFTMDSTNETIVHDLTSTSDTKWVLRFKANWSTLTASGSNQNWFGLSDGNQTEHADSSQKGIGVIPIYTSGTQKFITSSPNNQNPIGTNDTAGTYALTTGVDLYVTITRTSATVYTVDIRTGSHSGTVVENFGGNQTCNSQTGLRYIKFSNNATQSEGGVQQGTIDDVEFYNAVTSVTPATWTSGSGIVATGGVEEIVGGYVYRKFASSGTFAVTAGSGNLEVLIVGAGGAGGGDEGGGGGAGAIMVSNPFALSQRTYTVTIGDGGTSSGSGAGGAGGSTVFDTETATGGGGGGGGTANGTAGANGGGGAAGLGGHSGASNGGTGTAPIFSTLTGTVHAGNDGGNGHQGSSTAPGGGGGGAGGAGVAPSGAGAAGGNGGVGISIASFPTTLYWGGGGAGGCHGASGGTGGDGSGGGGADSSTTGGLAGTAGLNAGGSGAGEVGGAGGVNTGAGGGGSGWNGSGSGGTGGKGYVVVRHLE